MEVVHEHTDSGSNNASLLIALVILAGVGILFFGMIWPMISRSSVPQTPSIQVPDKIDVNINGGNPPQMPGGETQGGQ